MRTPLAWRNLVHNKVRTGVAVAGVTVAVTLIFMQLGFLGALRTTATIVYDALDFDLCIRSKQYLHLAEARTFPNHRLYQAASLTGVQQVTPFYVQLSQWRNPINGRQHGILAMGIEPESPVFTVPELQQQSRLLALPEDVLIDRQTRPEFGPQDGIQFGDGDIGVETEVALQRVQIVGHFSLGTGFAANGAILLNDRGFVRATPARPRDAVSLGLIKLEPGLGRADAERIAAQLNRLLPADVEAKTRDATLAFELDRWVYQTSFGHIFQLGVAVALVVGMAIVYQLLSSDIRRQLPEYATLKAVGYKDRYLAGVVLQQAMILSVAGFLPGLFVSMLLYRLTGHFAHIPMHMEWSNVLLVLGLSVAMCTGSGVAALRKLRRADPADLF